MRKMKKINGFLVVRFNDREKGNNPTLGSFGVIDAEQYMGDLDFDLDAMEYTDADRIEIAVEQARGLEAEEDFGDEPTTYTVIAETAEEATEEAVKEQPLQKGSIKDAGLPTYHDIRDALCNYAYSAKHASVWKDTEQIIYELNGFVRALEFLKIIPAKNADYWRAIGRDVLDSQPTRHFSQAKTGPANEQTAPREDGIHSNLVEHFRKERRVTKELLKVLSAPLASKCSQ